MMRRKEEKIGEALSVDQLISEKNLAEALGISKQVLYGFRQKGLPWLNIGGKVFYHEQTFMEWLLKGQKKVSDLDET